MRAKKFGWNYGETMKKKSEKNEVWKEESTDFYLPISWFLSFEEITQNFY